MHCTLENRQGMIDAYLREQLSETERDNFEEHYFDCQDCFNELRFSSEMAQLIRVEGKALLQSPTPCGRIG